MSKVTKKESPNIAPDSKVTGSAIYRMISPEDRKKLKEIAKEKAREMGLIINIIEK
ncbi:MULTISPECIES: hypothetical protein [unclassified Modicisalibacter]|uniref:hypothetical protein n=1 Tax=unclassified Modicisalibacter TaxID=2679913 RepID=UPI001CCE5DF1|nr:MULTISPECIES: hypothetical protein [unclassified Modicisalibacter]MBZ9560492.1 hypothetical protein [Modicisalibacter sp. R2A 31.J]MBZ9575104.1 hypothetical protein [Modicisalibacter sp. MOD 31.J]